MSGDDEKATRESAQGAARSGDEPAGAGGEGSKGRAPSRDSGIGARNAIGASNDNNDSSGNRGRSSIGGIGNVLGKANGSSYAGLSASLTFAASIALFTYGGYWLDGRLGTLPLFVLIGLACGLVGGFIHLVETVAPGTLFKKNARRRRGDGGEEGDGDAAA